MEWTPKLSTYREKIETDINTWMDYDVPKILPLCTRKKLFKRKFPSKLKDIMERYETKLEPTEIEFLSKVMKVKYESVEIDSTYQKVVGTRTKKSSKKIWKSRK